MAPKTLAYQAFVATFMALKAPFFRREHILQVPGVRNLAVFCSPDKEFIAEENVNYLPSSASVKERQTEEEVGTQAHDSPPTSHVLHCSALMFNPTPPLEKTEEYSLSAPDNEAELMRWHYCLGHASFTKLRQLASNGMIPKKLANVRPPKCAGCLFRAMTKIP